MRRQTLCCMASAFVCCTAACTALVLFLPALMRLKALFVKENDAQLCLINLFAGRTQIGRTKRHEAVSSELSLIDAIDINRQRLTLMCVYDDLLFRKTGMPFHHLIFWFPVRESCCVRRDKKAESASAKEAGCDTFT